MLLCSSFPTKRAHVALLVRTFCLTLHQPSGPRGRCWSVLCFQSVPTNRAERALLVRTFFLTSFFSDLHPSFKNAGTKHESLDGLHCKKILQPIGPKWHCWSGLRHALSRMPAPSTKLLMEFFSKKCPNQSGPSGTVGQDFKSSLPSLKILTNFFPKKNSQPSGPKWRCWSGLRFFVTWSTAEKPRQPFFPPCFCKLARSVYLLFLTWHATIL